MEKYNIRKVKQHFQIQLNVGAIVVEKSVERGEEGLMAGRIMLGWCGVRVSCWGCAWCQLRVVYSDAPNVAALTIIETSIFLWT